MAFASARGEAAVLLPLALLVNASIFVGLWTRPLLIVNVVLLRAVFAYCLDSYTADDVVQHFSLLFAFAPRPRALAVDAFLARDIRPAAPVPGLYVALVATGLGLIYADGLPYKLDSEIWRRGSAFWLGAALPHLSTGLMPQWAEREMPMRLCTWLALGYEAFFTLILVRRLRSLMAALGLAVHLGSGIFMALPQFALVMASMVLLFVRWPARSSDPDTAAAARASARAWSAAVGVLIALMIVAQLSLNVGPYRHRPPGWLCRVLAIDRRAIFIDWHFRLPGPLLRFVAVEGGVATVLPSFDDEGYPQIHDRYWKFFGFTLRSTDWKREAVVGRYVRGMLERAGRPAPVVEVQCKDLHLRSLDLDFDADDELRRRPWQPCATISFAR